MNGILCLFVMFLTTMTLVLCGEEDWYPLTDAEHVDVVELHNYYRRLEGSSDMMMLVCVIGGFKPHKTASRTLRSMASAWTSACRQGDGEPPGDWGRTGTSQLSSKSDNMAKRLNASAAVLQWLSAKPNYNYAADTCSGGNCNAYKQVVWGQTLEVGCAVAKCDSLLFTDGTVISATPVQWVVCFYWPGGGYPQRPHLKGASCTRCHNTYLTCLDGLCLTSNLTSCQSYGCSCEAVCENGATLTEDCRCNCDTYWKGVACDTPCENNPTAGCDGYGTEYCDPTSVYFPWFSSNCPENCGYCGLTANPTPPDSDQCESSPCQHGATCVDGESDYGCDCSAGFSGKNCEFNVDECESYPCENGATCGDDIALYTCQCGDGYTGVHCETNIDECVSAPCQNGGSCTNGANEYTCTCPEGFGGTHCERLKQIKKTIVTKIVCMYNCVGSSNPSERIALKSNITNLPFEQLLEAHYLWTVEFPTYSEKMPLWPSDTTTGFDQPNLVIKSGVFSRLAVTAYDVKLTVLLDGITGTDSMKIMMNKPPTKGKCDVQFKAGKALKLFVIQCTGFSSFNSPLYYKHSTEIDGDNTILYYGSLAATPELYLPLGDENNGYKLTINSTVKDSKGASVSITTTVQVEADPERKPQTLDAMLELLGTTESVFTYITAAAADLSHKPGSQEERIKVRDKLVQDLVSMPVKQDIVSIQQAVSALREVTKEKTELSVDSIDQAASFLHRQASEMEALSEAEPEEVSEAGRRFLECSSNLIGSAEYLFKQKIPSQSEAQNDVAWKSKLRNITTASLSVKETIVAEITKNLYVGEQATTLKTDNIFISLQKKHADNVGKSVISYEESKPLFVLPSQMPLPRDKEIQIQVERYKVNPYFWAVEEAAKEPQYQLESEDTAERTTDKRPRREFPTASSSSQPITSPVTVLEIRAGDEQKPLMLQDLKEPLVIMSERTGEVKVQLTNLTKNNLVLLEMYVKADEYAYVSVQPSDPNIDLSSVTESTFNVGKKPVRHWETLDVFFRPGDFDDPGESSTTVTETTRQTTTATTSQMAETSTATTISTTATSTRGPPSDAECDIVEDKDMRDCGDADVKPSVCSHDLLCCWKETYPGLGLKFHGDCYMPLNYTVSNIEMQNTAAEDLPTSNVGIPNGFNTILPTSKPGYYTHLLKPKPEEMKGAIELRIVSTTLKCVYWDAVTAQWSSIGCKPIRVVNLTTVECGCTHMSTYASSYVVKPNTVDYGGVALFTKVWQNPIGLIAVCILLILYFYFAIMLRRRDKKRELARSAVDLADNLPNDDYAFIVTVETGNAWNAGTSADVWINLEGDKGQSESRNLNCFCHPIFQRDKMDYFLLKTSATLGDITSITLSHGSEGPQPHWYVRSSLVYDVQTGKKYIFICNSWLSNTKTTRPEDPPSTTKTFAVADAVKTHIGGLLLLNSTHDLKQRHLWLSLFKCSDQSHFSLSQRLVCLLCLFMMSMLINVMFFGVDDLPTNKVIKAGTLTYSTTKLMISIQSALMMIPSTLLLVKFFTSCRPRYPFHVIREEVSLYEEDGSHHPASLHPSKMFHHRVNSRPVTPHGKRSILSTGISLASVFSASRLGYWYKHSLESNRVRAAPEAREQDHSMNKNSTLDRSQQRLPSSQHNIQNTGPIVAEETTVSSNTMPAPAIAKPKEPQPIQTINIKIPQPKSHGQDLLTVDIPGMNEVFSRPGTRMTVSVYPLDELAYKQTTDNLLETEIVGGRAVRRSGPPLPWWCLIFAWLLVVLVTGTCAFHIVLYTFNYGYEKSYNWAMSVLVSKVLDIFLFDPLRIAGVCCLFTIYYKKFYIESLPLDIDVGAKEKDRGALGKIKEVMLS